MGTFILTQLIGDIIGEFALDDTSGYPLYVKFIKSETTADYLNVVRSIEARGYLIKGLIISTIQPACSLQSSDVSISHEANNQTLSH